MQKTGKYLLIILPLIAVLLASTFAIAQSEIRPKIKTLGVLGEGFAISSTNPADFKVLRIGLARIIVNLAGTETDVNVGLLYVDGEKYVLKNVQIGNGTASGDIYSNNTQVGSFKSDLVTKEGRDAWYGTMTLSGTTYNTYIVAAHRVVKASEAAENIRDTCKENPERCRDLAKSIRGIGNICDNEGSENCRDKIKDYCEDNPTDSRCTFVFRDYCAKHTDDHRCVSELKEYCRANATDERCEDFCEKYPRVCALKRVTDVKGISGRNTGSVETTANVETAVDVKTTG